jgi:hypothetical protein
LAEAHKFGKGGLHEAVQVYPDLPWHQDGNGNASIWDAKQETYVPVVAGQFIVKVADRYEVRDTDELPKTVKPATDADAKPVEKAIEAKEAAKESDKD